MICLPEWLVWLVVGTVFVAGFVAAVAGVMYCSLTGDRAEDH